MYWLEISVTTDGEAAEAVADLLRDFAHGGGVVLEQLGDMTSSDPSALEPYVTVKIYVPGDQDVPSLRNRIDEALYHMNRLYPIPPATYRRLEEEDWSRSWKKGYRPFRVGRHLWIQPSWLDNTPPARDIVITMDPGMAFGTGLHPSTQMCLRFLEDVLQPNHRVLDVGTGTGILAIAAAKLGATSVLAFDTDPMATKAAVQNAERNGVSDKMLVYQGTIEALKPSQWNLIVVNILAPVIVTLLCELSLFDYLHVDGRLILSGIIDEQVAEVERALHLQGGFVERTIKVRDWVSLLARKEKRS